MENILFDLDSSLDELTLLLDKLEDELKELINECDTLMSSTV